MMTKECSIVEQRALGALCVEHPWFGAARSEAAKAGAVVAESYLMGARLRNGRTSPTAHLKEIRPEEFERSEMLGIIDAFIQKGDNHKIVIAESTTEEALTSEGDKQIDDEEEFISEELAEIYAKQHLFDQAIEIYQKLSLQNPQKSIYFAELIEQLNAQKDLNEK